MSFVSNPFSIPFDRVIPGVAGTPAMTVRDATDPLNIFSEYNPNGFQNNNNALVDIVGNTTIPFSGFLGYLQIVSTPDGAFALMGIDSASQLPTITARDITNNNRALLTLAGPTEIGRPHAELFSTAAGSILMDVVTDGGFPPLPKPSFQIADPTQNVKIVADIDGFAGGNGNARIFIQSRAGGTNLNIAVKPDRSATATLGAGVLPATPEGFLSWELDGNVIKIPYYNL